MKKIKKMALQTIVLAMDGIRKEIETSPFDENITSYAQAMAHLAEAFKTVKEC